MEEVSRGDLKSPLHPDSNLRRRYLRRGLRAKGDAARRSSSSARCRASRAARSLKTRTALREGRSARRRIFPLGLPEPRRCASARRSSIYERRCRMGRATHPDAYCMIAGREKMSGRVRDPTDRVASRRHIGAREHHRTASTALFDARIMPNALASACPYLLAAHCARSLRSRPDTAPT